MAKKEWIPKAGDRVKFTTHRGRSGTGKIVSVWQAKNGSTWYTIAERDRHTVLRRAQIERA